MRIKDSIDRTTRRRGGDLPAALRCIHLPQDGGCSTRHHGYTTGNTPPTRAARIYSPTPSMAVPFVVRHAIETFVAHPGFTIAPKGKNHTSVAFSWGVRLCEREDRDHFWWVCLASDQCRAIAADPQHQRKARINMMRGKTSKATMHLSTVHNIVAPKTEMTSANQRQREGLIADYQASFLFRQNPGRFMVLLETMKIVLNNLPFCSVEYEEAILLRKLCYKTDFAVTLNAKIVMHTMLELYACAKREIVGHINASRMATGACFSFVTDFWTAKAQAKKYVGVRLYMVDATFRFRSILLGTRQFNPTYGDRSREKCGHGLRYPFRRWIVDILRDFGLKETDLFGATSDGGADVKWMMSNGFKFQWEWCLAHLSNAATKAACGLVDDTSKSSNKAMTRLLKRIVTTVYQTKHVEVMGTLFEELCLMISADSTVQLLDYRSHRFLGLTRVVDRILTKWSVLKEWYKARQDKACHEGTTPPEFPLSGHKRDLTQLLSMLRPITANNAHAQAESPVQVDVLLGLYKLCLKVINPTVPLRDHRSLPPPAVPEYIAIRDLTPLVAVTRQLLSEAYHTCFFKRYTCVKAMNQCSFVFEMQLLLHPDYKVLDASMKPTVLLCHRLHRPDADDHQTLYADLIGIITAKLTKLIATFVAPAHEPQQQPQAPVMDENLAMFSQNHVEHRHEVHADSNQIAAAELSLWLSDRTALLRDEDGAAEQVTAYWRRQVAIKRYKLLPLVARVLFSVPSSSDMMYILSLSRLERDFGVSGMQLTPQRASTAAHNVDMCAFVNRNREFIDLTQCTPILAADRVDHIPTNILVNLTPYDENNIDFEEPVPLQVFSNTSIYDDVDEETKGDA